jgi:hypothetical protein
MRALRDAQLGDVSDALAAIRETVTTCEEWEATLTGTTKADVAASVPPSERQNVLHDLTRRS